MTLKKAKEIIELDLEKVKVGPETDPEIRVENWTIKKDSIKVSKKVRNKWIWYSYSSSKLLKINQQKTEIMGRANL